MNEPPQAEAEPVPPIEPAYIYLKDRVDPIGRFLLGLPSHLSLLEYPLSLLLNLLCIVARKKQDTK